MNGLSYLLLTKWKASLRSVFTKPLAAVFTVLAVVGFGALLIFSAASGAGQLMVQHIKSLEMYVMILLGYILLLFCMILVQKRTALVLQADARFILGGPFSKRQALGYILYDTVRGCVLYSVFTIYFLLVTVISYNVTLEFILSAVFMLLLVYYILFAGIALFYLLEITARHIRRIKILFIAGLVLLILLLAVKNIIASGFDIRIGFSQFLTDRLFYFVPVFGWAKLGLISAAKGAVGGILLGFLLNLLTAAAVTVAVLNIKGDFYEKAVEDAEWITDVRQRTEKGRNDNGITGLKIRDVGHIRFRSGAYAVLSKNILQMRKTKSWIRKQEVFLIALYLLIAKVNGMNFTGYQYFIMIIVFISVSSDTMLDELKTHYIYLIPDTPANKIISVAAPIFLRTCLIVLVALVPAAFVFGQSAGQLVISLLTMWGYAAVFDAGNVWSVRLLKSGTNRITEQFMKMGIILAGCIPSMILSLVLLFLMGLGNPSFPSVVSAVTVTVNLLVGLGFILMAKGMFRGSDVMSE